MKGTDNTGILVPKKVTGHRIFLGGLHTWEMKNFVRRWWKSHDTPEFQRSIVADTIRRCTWSVSERAWQLVIIMWLMGRETSSTSLRMCRNILKCVSKSLCGFLRFGQFSTTDFFVIIKNDYFPHSALWLNSGNGHSIAPMLPLLSGILELAC